MCCNDIIHFVCRRGLCAQPRHSRHRFLWHPRGENLAPQACTVPAFSQDQYLHSKIPLDSQLLRSHLYREFVPKPPHKVQSSPTYPFATVFSSTSPSIPFTLCPLQNSQYPLAIALLPLYHFKYMILYDYYLYICHVLYVVQYPDAWGANSPILPDTDSWFDENYIGDRARLVHSMVDYSSSNQYFDAPVWH